MPYKDKAKKAAADRRYREKHKGQKKDYQAQWWQENKARLKQARDTYRKENKDTINACIKEWSANNPDKCKKYSQSSYRKLLTNPKKYLLQHAKARANKSGIDFNIEEIDITIPDVCPVFGTPFEYRTQQAMSLDRIDNSKGYIKGNIQVISYKANAMKYSATTEELEKFAKWILNPQ